MKEKRDFEIGEIICDSCRVGLDSNLRVCNHLKQEKIKKLAFQLADFENSRENQNKPSELFNQVEAYVQDPEFWYHTVNLDEKLHLHARPWLRRAFLDTSRRQLLRLSGRVIKTSKMKKFFVKRSRQVSQIAGKSDKFQVEQDFEYYLFNQKRQMALQN